MKSENLNITFLDIRKSAGLKREDVSKLFSIPVYNIGRFERNQFQSNQLTLFYSYLACKDMDSDVKDYILYLLRIVASNRLGENCIKIIEEVTNGQEI